MKKVKTQNTKTTVPFYRSIKTRLVLSFLIPIVCIFALGVISYEKAASAIVDNYKQATQQTAGMIGQYIDFLVRSEKNDFKSYIGADDLITYTRMLSDTNTLTSIKNDYLEEMRSKINQDENVANIYFLLDDGRSIADHTVYLTENAYSAYKDTAQGAAVIADGYSWFLFGQDEEADTVLNLDTGAYSLRLARRLNTLSCVMVIDISCNVLRNTLNSLDPGENGYVALITGEGSEFYSDKNVNTESPLIYGTDFYEAALSDVSLSGNRTVTIDGENYLFVYDRSDEYGFMIASLIPEDVMLSGTKDIQTASMVMILISIGIALILGSLISGRICGTISYILRRLDQVSEGDLTVHMITKKRDEFGLLCDGINDTVSHVKDLIVNVNEVSTQLTEEAAYVSETSGMFLETSQDIQKAVTEIEIGVNRLDMGSEDCMTQMDSLSGKISNVSRNADEIEKLTAETGDTILSGIDSVQGLTESAESTTAITQSVLAAIQELEQKSRSIGDITTVINQIARQTKMLSLNATIEAAHAGNAGRGFAVVAAEIRGLSDKCLGSADQIASIVSEIETQTKDVVKIAGQVEKVVSTQTDVVEETTESFHQIDRQVGFLLEALATISSNVQEMNRSRTQTLDAIESISAVSAETAACSSSVHTSAGSQLDAIKDLDLAAQDLRERAARLSGALASFTV